MRITHLESAAWCGFLTSKKPGSNSGNSKNIGKKCTFPLYIYKGFAQNLPFSRIVLLIQ